MPKATKTNKKSKKTNSKLIKSILLFIIIAVIVYIIVKVMALIITPTDMVVVENGTVCDEESAVRIYNKRRNNNKR